MAKLINWLFDFNGMPTSLALWIYRYELTKSTYTVFLNRWL